MKATELLGHCIRAQQGTLVGLLDFPEISPCSF
jgi:hypothetical protein